MRGPVEKTGTGEGAFDEAAAGPQQAAGDQQPDRPVSHCANVACPARGKVLVAFKYCPECGTKVELETVKEASNVRARVQAINDTLATSPGIPNTNNTIESLNMVLKRPRI